MERLLPALWPALGFAGLYLVARPVRSFRAHSLAAAGAVAGRQPSPPSACRWHAGFDGFAWPSWKDGARRLERDSGLAHRPISEGQDRLIGERSFCRWRCGSCIRRAAGLRPAASGAGPGPIFARRDPRYLRYGVLLLLAVGLVLARGDWSQRLIARLRQRRGHGGEPGCLGRSARLYRAGRRSIWRRRQQNVIAVPAGSVLNLRAHGAPHPPGLSLGGVLGMRSRRASPATNGEYADTARLTPGCACAGARQWPCHRRLAHPCHSRCGAADCLHRHAGAHRTPGDADCLPRQRRLRRDWRAGL